MASNQQRKHRAEDILVDTRMKRLYDTTEPNIISNKMLTQSVYEQGPREEAGRIAKGEGILFATVKSLRLDFKNILYISNLTAFTSLTKLQLVNNLLEKIENLEKLIHLEWLDLSFNKIEKIEGLETLTKLTDLSLFFNRIVVLRNLDNLVELNVFSIGNNLLSSIDNVLYLRRFKKLNSLNLDGNPLCDTPDYYSFMFAFFPKLMFLDYKMITTEEHQISYEKYLIRVEQFKEKEVETENKEAENVAMLEARKIHSTAFIELLDTDALFLQMIDEDPEKEKIFSITGIEDLTIIYKEKFLFICNELFNKGLIQLEKRDKDSLLFYECINSAKQDNNQRALDLVSEFNVMRNQILHDMNVTNTAIESDISRLKEAVYDLWSYLMSLEVQLFDQLEETIRDYSRNLSEMIDSFLEIVNTYFSQMRDLEGQHSERIAESASVVFEKIVKGDMDEDRMNNYKKFDIFIDKDAMAACLSASHDCRLLKIDSWEDKIKNNAHKWLEETCDNIKQNEEHIRNRNRVTEINNFIDHVRGEIENFELPGINTN